MSRSDYGDFEPRYETEEREEPSDSFVLQRRYKVISYLGQGGMGTVYLAQDTRLANRPCVVKKLRDDFFRAEDKEKALSFFQREVQILSLVKHPNIVHIGDYFEERGEYYLVMEYIEGRNLQEILTERGEPFSEEQVFEWAGRIADVLDCLHNNDPVVIYRDLKPSNIMLDDSGNLKLVDFGIARPYQDDSDNTHVVSAGYSPPEQYWGAADPRSDIYALGATMHFLLTGQEPLALQTSSPQKVRPGLSDRVDDLVQKSTQQDLYLRYQSAKEIKQDLFIPVSDKKNKLKHMAPLLLPISLVLLLLMTGTYFLFAMGTQVPPMKEDKENQSEQVKKLKQEYEQNLEAKDKENRDLQEKNLKLLRDYAYAANQNEKGTSALASGAGKRVQLDPVSIGIGTKSMNGSSRSSQISFQVRDEAQLTDPDGLAPLDADDSRVVPAPMKLPMFGGHK